MAHDRLPHDVPLDGNPENTAGREPDQAAADDVQVLLNDAKRAEMEKHYGAKFFKPKTSRIPPEVEAEWLAHVEAMERRMRDAVDVPLRQLVDLPFVLALADLPPGSVEDELEALLDHLARHSVFVDFPDEVEAQEAYRFIVEELLDEPVLDLRGPGTRMRFVYGERS